MKKVERLFKVGKRLVCGVTHNNLCLRAYLFVLNASVSFYDYVPAGLTGVALALILMHPMILFAFLMSFNIIGDLTRNIICLSVFLVDCALSFAGGVIVEYARTQ